MYINFKLTSYESGIVGISGNQDSMRSGTSEVQEQRTAGTLSSRIRSDKEI